MPHTPAAPRPTRRSLMQGGLAVVTTLPLIGCGPPSMPTYRYRLKVEVDTPQGLRTGSSVIEVTNRLALNINGGGYSFLSEARGEAAAVELPGGRTLFALLRAEGWLNNEWPARIVYQLAPRVPFSKDRCGLFRADQLNNAVSNRAEITLPVTKVEAGQTLVIYPQLVTFGDNQKPETVARVDPRNASEVLGVGFSIRRITVQITDDSRTEDIERRLPWLREKRGTLIPHPPAHTMDAGDLELRLLDTGSFSTEIFK